MQCSSSMWQKALMMLLPSVFITILTIAVGSVTIERESTSSQHFALDQPSRKSIELTSSSNRSEEEQILRLSTSQFSSEISLDKREQRIRSNVRPLGFTISWSGSGIARNHSAYSRISELESSMELYQERTWETRSRQLRCWVSSSEEPRLLPLIRPQFFNQPQIV